MKFDRNTVLGFLVLGVLFIGYFWYTNKEQAAYRKQKQEQLAKEQFVRDSIDRVNKPKQDSLAKINDSLIKTTNAGEFQKGVTGNEQLVTIENAVLRITFTTKGGQPKKVELKNYKGQDSTLVKLAATSFDKISYTINTGPNKTAQTSELFFSKIDSALNSDGTKPSHLS
jgi:YidC/Oxa1 family membrane protein insertase